MGTSLSSLSDSAVSVYADNFFQYDSSHRVSEEIAAGAGSSSATNPGQGTFTYSQVETDDGSHRGHLLERAVMTRICAVQVRQPRLILPGMTHMVLYVFRKGSQFKELRREAAARFCLRYVSGHVLGHSHQRTCASTSLPF